MFHTYLQLLLEIFFCSDECSASYARDMHRTYVVLMQSVRYCYPVLIKIGVCRQILAEILNIKLHENLSAVSKLCANIDYMAKLISVFFATSLGTRRKYQKKWLDFFNISRNSYS